MTGALLGELLEVQPGFSEKYKEGRWRKGISGEATARGKTWRWVKCRQRWERRAPRVSRPRTGLKNRYLLH